MIEYLKEYQRECKNALFKILCKTRRIHVMRRNTITNIEKSIFRTYTNSVNTFYVKVEGNIRAMENIFEYIIKI